MQDYYLIITIADVQKDEAAILEVLTAIMQKKLPNDLKLLNYYKEVPISFGATINNIEQAMADMTVHQTQASIMLKQKITFLKSAHLPHDVFAKVQKVRIEKKLAFLTQFSYAQIRSERRENVRVKVSDNLEVAFQSDDQLLRGTLHDISIGGLSLHAPQHDGIEEGAPGKISLCLAGAKLEVACTLLRVIRGDVSNRYLFKMETTSRIEGLISQFIFQLQSEIIRELKEQL